MERILDEGDVPFLEIETEGAKNIMEEIGRENVISIFLAPPSLEALIDRIRGRGTENESQIAIKSHRVGEHPGEHKVIYDSPIETIELRHSSKTRQGLAMGALMAAKFLIGKKGIYGMDDLLKLT